MDPSLTGLEVLPPDEAYHLGNHSTILPSVSAAVSIIQNASAYNHEYQPSMDVNQFLTLAPELTFGTTSPGDGEGELNVNVSSVQTISGNGTNNLGAVFLNNRLRSS
ncbi:hypothetical protein BDV12DRAFT_203935 [Aspergillus spectabilis]